MSPIVPLLLLLGCRSSDSELCTPGACDDASLLQFEASTSDSVLPYSAKGTFNLLSLLLLMYKTRTVALLSLHLEGWSGFSHPSQRMPNKD